LSLLPALQKEPRTTVSYDQEGDVLYVSLSPGAVADDSDLGEDDILVRYKEGQIIGYTILHASQRIPA
jgi:uncharacterized protein YuzE